MSTPQSHGPVNNSTPWEGVVYEGEYGPKIVGTRITIYTIYYYVLQGWHHTTIAALLSLSSDEVLAVMAYIDAHREQVDAVHQQIEARHARGNPPEVQAKLDAIHAEFAPIWAERRRTLG
jgi:uncharacterized protein (DUF433 family)